MSGSLPQDENIVYRMFNEIQTSPKKLEQFAELCATIYANSSDLFTRQFSNCVYTLLPKKGSNKDIQGLISFIAVAVCRCNGNDSTPSLAPIFIEDILSYTKTKDRLVRLHSLQIINAILNHSKELELEERVIKKLKQCYIERCRDKVIAVRSVAAAGLCLLQNADDPDEEVLSQLNHNLQFESVSSIRSIYASSIMIHPNTVEGILTRLRDEDIMIRLHLIHNIRDHSLIQHLPIKLRHALIYSLQDRNEVIVKATESLLIAWCERNNILFLLSLLDLDEDEMAGELFLNAVFHYEQDHHVSTFTDKASISLTQLSSYTSFYLYSIVRFLFEQKRETSIDYFIPDIPAFCNLISSSAFDPSTDRRVFRNILRCLQYLDISDEVCKTEVLRVIRYIFAIPMGICEDLVVQEEHVHVLLQALLNLVDSEPAFLSELSLMISDLEDLLPPNEQSHSFSPESIQLLALFIVQSGFKLISTKGFAAPEVKACFERVIMPCLESPLAELRREAVRGLVLSAIMNKEIARQYSSLLICMILEEDEDAEVQQAAIQGLTDILIVYGDLQRNDLEEDELGVGVVDVVESLNHYVFHTNEMLQFACCNAFCRLFVFDKIHSLLHLSNLILLLFDSSTIHRTLLRQMLAVFFPSFANPQIDKNCLFLGEGVVYTIKGIAEACLADRYPMITEMGRFFLTLMTITIKQSVKRIYEASDDDDDNDSNSNSNSNNNSINLINEDVHEMLEEEEQVEEGGRKGDKQKRDSFIPVHHYHRCVYNLLENLMKVAQSKKDDQAFQKEVVLLFSYVDPELIDRNQREKVNSMLIQLYDVGNASMKRIIKSKNNAFLKVDPSLTKL